ncbi:hypothetical protein LTR49_027152, partial [Elasticomyces elasticus]
MPPPEDWRPRLPNGLVMTDEMIKQGGEECYKMHGSECRCDGDISYVYAGERLDSTASAPECVRRCKTCSTQFWATEAQEKWKQCQYDGVYADPEAKAIIDDHIAATQQNLSQLRKLIDEHGDTI